MKRILISGCSGGGKSTVLSELGRRGYATIEEPGRRIVAEEKSGAGTALPWVDLEAFALRALELARSDLREARAMPDLVFFDRGLIDAAVALQGVTGTPLQKTIGENRHYWDVVFFAPPWPEIFCQDDDRRHSFDDAIAEFERLECAFQDLGYETCLLPKVPVQDRADFILDRFKGDI